MAGESSRGAEHSPAPQSRAGRRPLDYFFDETAQRNVIYIVTLGAAGSLLVAYLYSVMAHPVDWIRHATFLFGMGAFLWAAVAERRTGSIAQGGSIVILAGIAMTVVPACPPLFRSGFWSSHWSPACSWALEWP